MSKQRRITGEGQGVPLTIWVSEKTREAIEAEAAKTHTKRSTIARKVLEAKFGA